MAKLIYTVDGKDLKDFGIYVADSDGLIDRPKTKKPLSVNWDDYHGVAVDLQNRYLEARDITLTCFIAASGKLDFIDKLTSFVQLFDKPGTLRLSVSADPVRPLVYEVYCEDSITIKKQWDEGQMIGTFTLKLKEPEPVKKVLHHNAQNEAHKTCWLRFTSAKLVNVYWGDGNATFDVLNDTAQTISHRYENNGHYYIVMTGDIDKIIELTSNATIRWNKL